MNDITLSLSQILQLVGVVQCVYVIALTLVRTDDYRFAALPVMLFAAIAVGFGVQLLMTLTDIGESPFLNGVYLFVETAVPALMYLMVIELAKRRIPASPHWLILGLPLLAVPAINVAVQAETVCLGADGSFCVEPYPMFSLFRVVAGVAILLLLLAVISRDLKSLLTQTMGKEKYWIVIALIGAIISLLTVNLLSAFEVLNESEAVFVTTVLELTLIYLLISSLFRVYGGAVTIRTSRDKGRDGEREPLNDEEIKLVERINELMTLDKVYQEASYSRKDLAQELTIAEHQLSRIINTGFAMSFSDLINNHRVEEAKYLLRTTDEPVSSIAFDVGFNSLASFNRVFRKVTDQTPTAFRQNGGEAPAP